ncbi:MAG: ABC transporter substrate-binding protein, partial [Anaerolineales bacterium]
AALADRGMKSPKDWEGKLVGFKGTPPPDLYALLAAAKADVNKVNLVNVGFDPRVLTEGKVDVYPLFKSNEPYLIQKWGYNITLWDAADYGVPTLGLTYVTSEDFISQHPDELRRFVKAAIQGIQYATDHPDEAVQVVMQYAGAETDPEHMRFMLSSEIKDANNSQGVGWQTKEQWQALANMLFQYQALPKPIAVDSAFTTKFLP